MFIHPNVSLSVLRHNPSSSLCFIDILIPIYFRQHNPSLCLEILILVCLDIIILVLVYLDILIIFLGCLNILNLVILYHVYAVFRYPNPIPSLFKHPNHSPILCLEILIIVLICLDILIIVNI